MDFWDFLKAAWDNANVCNNHFKAEGPVCDVAANLEDLQQTKQTWNLVKVALHSCWFSWSIQTERVLKKHILCSQLWRTRVKLGGRKTSRTKCSNIHHLWRSCGENGCKTKNDQWSWRFCWAEWSGMWFRFWFFHFSSAGFKTQIQVQLYAGDFSHSTSTHLHYSVLLVPRSSTISGSSHTCQDSLAPYWACTSRQPLCWPGNAAGRTCWTQGASPPTLRTRPGGTGQNQITPDPDNTDTWSGASYLASQSHFICAALSLGAWFI